MALFMKANQRTAHANDVIVRVRAEDEDRLRLLSRWIILNRCLSILKDPLTKICRRTMFAHHRSYR